jgi:hypothetical protein
MQLICEECENDIQKYAEYHEVDGSILCDRCYGQHLYHADPLIKCYECGEIIHDKNENHGLYIDINIKGERKIAHVGCITHKEFDPVRLREEQME